MAKRFLIKLKTPAQMAADAGVIERLRRHVSYVSTAAWIDEQLQSVREQLNHHPGFYPEEGRGFETYPLYAEGHELHDMFYVVEDGFLRWYSGFEDLEAIDYCVELP
jgi:hypothetical protein